MLEWLKTILGEAHTEDIDKKVSEQIGKDFVSRADFNAANEEKKTLAKTIKERDTQLEELKKADPAALQTKITELQTANTAAQAKFDDELKKTKLEYALDTRLLKENVVNAKAVKALLDTAKISLDGENLVGLDEQLTALKTTEKWAFGTPGKAGLPHGGAPDGGGTGDTLADEIKGALFGGTK